MFETRSGCPFNSTEQREYFDKCKKEAFLGLEAHLGDPELYKLPIFGIFRDYKLWQKFDFKNKIPQIHPVQLFLNTYKEFLKNCEDLEFATKSKFACKDIGQKEYDYIMEELELRKLFMESQLFPSKKKYLNNLLSDEKKRHEFYERLPDSIIYNAKTYTRDSGETPENSPDEVNV